MIRESEKVSVKTLEKRKKILKKLEVGYVITNQANHAYTHVDVADAVTS